MVLRCGNRWIFRRQIGVVITQHNVVEDLAHQRTNRRTRATVLQIMATATCGLLYGAKAVISLWSRKRSAILCAL
ncbi:hypothetical protein ACLK2I_03470 [Escherichia coli]